MGTGNPERPASLFILKLGAAVAAFALLSWLAWRYLPINGRDWTGTFRPAALEMLAGRSPYSLPVFYNPPWVLLPLIPLALLREDLGSALLFTANLAGYVYGARRLGAKGLPIAAFLLTGWVLANSLNGNLEGLLAAGYALPPPWGMFFALAKPQASGALALYWLVQAWRAGGWRSALKVAAPVSLVLALSFVLYGFWPAATPRLPGAYWDASLWPYGLPVGAVLLYLALRYQKPCLAISASPFLAPYLTGHTWASLPLGLLPFLPGYADIRRWLRQSGRIRVNGDR
jgi:hypothetical protein